MNGISESGRKRLATIGEVLTVFLSTDQLPLSSGRQFHRITAGAEANVAAGFVRLGHLASLATVIGEDATGDGALSDLLSWGIQVNARRSDRPTGVIVRTPGGGSNSGALHMREGAAAESLDERESAAAWGEGADAVFVTGITMVRSESARRAVLDLVRRARVSGATVIIDPNVRLSLGSLSTYSAALAEIRGEGDIALGSAEELAALAGTRTEDATKTLLDFGYRIVVEKRGALGALASDTTGTYESPSVAWSVVDTVGAGDAFTSGFVTAVLEGLDLQKALDRGSLVAAHVVATPGDVEGIPIRRDLINSKSSIR